LAQLGSIGGCSKGGEVSVPPDGGPTSDGSTGLTDQANEAAGQAIEPFGKPCSKPGSECPDLDLDGVSKLICVAPEGGAPGQGFCSRKCDDKTSAQCYQVPNGQWASCVLKNDPGDAGPVIYYCAFICASPKGNYTCPPGLSCESGNRDTSLCVP
jgi:hypothetical protein